MDMRYIICSHLWLRFTSSVKTYGSLGCVTMCWRLGIQRTNSTRHSLTNALRERTDCQQSVEQHSQLGLSLWGSHEDRRPKGELRLRGRFVERKQQVHLGIQEGDTAVKGEEGSKVACRSAEARSHWTS